MKIMKIAACLLVLFASQSHAAVLHYTTDIQTTGIDVDANSTTKVKYVDYSSGKQSKTSEKSIDMDLTGDWTFDFKNNGRVDFTGNVFMGSYRTQTNVTGTVTIDGRQSYRKGNHFLEGRGDYDADTREFTFHINTGKDNSSNASDFTYNSKGCENGKTSSLGKVCKEFKNTSTDWEGLDLVFKFKKDFSSFSGEIIGVDKSGSGLTAQKTDITFDIQGIQEVTAVPVPASAWLFGSALVGLASIGRNRG